MTDLAHVSESGTPDEKGMDVKKAAAIRLAALLNENKREGKVYIVVSNKTPQARKEAEDIYQDLELIGMDVNPKGLHLSYTKTTEYLNRPGQTPVYSPPAKGSYLRHLGVEGFLVHDPLDENVRPLAQTGEEIIFKPAGLEKLKAAVEAAGISHALLTRPPQSVLREVKTAEPQGTILINSPMLF